jgi:hypothetical protein
LAAKQTVAPLAIRFTPTFVAKVEILYACKIHKEMRQNTKDEI